MFPAHARDYSSFEELVGTLHTGLLNGVDNAGGVSGKIQYLKETYCKDCRVISSRNSKNLWVAMIFSDGDGN